MVESELEQNLKKGVISQKEYDYLIQNRTSALPSYYKSIQFILILGLVPLLQTIIRMFMTHALNSTSILRIDQVIFAGIFFLIYKFTKKAPLKMAAWVWLIITLGSIPVQGIFTLLLLLMR